LQGQKHLGDAKNTCCEGQQGTRPYGALPQRIFTSSDDGIFVNLFVSSAIRWYKEKYKIGLQMITRFPNGDKVELAVSTVNPNRFN
jgi:DUF1680 family protein